MIKSIKVLLCGKNVIYCHFFDKITRIPSGRIVVPSGRIAVPLMGGFLVLEGKSGGLPSPFGFQNTACQGGHGACPLKLKHFQNSDLQKGQFLAL